MPLPHFFNAIAISSPYNDPAVSMKKKQNSRDCSNPQFHESVWTVFSQHDLVSLLMMCQLSIIHRLYIYIYIYIYMSIVVRLGSRTNPEKNCY